MASGNDDPQSPDGLMARLDERTRNMQIDLHELSDKFDEYVTHVEFTPVKLIAFGLAGLILCSVIAAVIATVLGGRH